MTDLKWWRRLMFLDALKFNYKIFINGDTKCRPVQVGRIVENVQIFPFAGFCYSFDGCKSEEREIVLSWNTFCHTEDLFCINTYGKHKGFEYLHQRMSFCINYVFFGVFFPVYLSFCDPLVFSVFLQQIPVPFCFKVSFWGFSHMILVCYLPMMSWKLMTCDKINTSAIHANFGHGVTDIVNQKMAVLMAVFLHLSDVESSQTKP